MRLAFLGTPAAAVPSLRALVAAGHDVEVVVTRPDRKRGRGAALLPSPVKEAATDLGLFVTDDVDGLRGRGLDLGVVVAYGRILKPDLLAEVPMVNIHFSLLPRWRGAAPVERAILAGDLETGVCLMEVEEGLDTGGVYAMERVAIGVDESAEELRARLAIVGADLLVDRLGRGLGEPVPQVGEPTYAAKVDPAELHLDFVEPAALLARRTRVGRAWTTLGGRRLLVLRATAEPSAPVGSAEPVGTVAADLTVATGAGRLRLLEVQPEGKAPMTAEAWARGARPAGSVLGALP
jgi:methionyl-tRNA formyltransferase